MKKNKASVFSKTKNNRTTFKINTSLKPKDVDNILDLICEYLHDDADHFFKYAIKPEGSKYAIALIHGSYTYLKLWDYLHSLKGKHITEQLPEKDKEYGTLNPENFGKPIKLNLEDE